jgi:hypothetical protein
VKYRSPSFCNLQALPQLIKGHLVSDVVALIGSIDIVLGEVASQAATIEQDRPVPRVAELERLLRLHLAGAGRSGGGDQRRDCK